VPEPLGGAQHDYDLAARNAREALITHLDALAAMTPAQVRKDRQDKFRKIGAFKEP
jgi:acetyl-CoA carboxylase carboxyl transferase subunit alpha